MHLLITDPNGSVPVGKPLYRLFKWITLICLFAFFIGCSTKKESKLFTAIPSSESGIDFENTITETDQLNLITNEYTYMGGGVGIGDFNNDGLQDIFFSANQTSSKLYINKGDFKFEDVTKSSGINTQQWCTGVSIVDINNDGWQDIYLCVSGPVEPSKRKNLLFINNHDLNFTEMAAAYGIDDESHSTQAAFLDYDKDGLLDMFLLTHQMLGESMNKIIPRVLDGSSPRNDKLFHNEGINPKTGHPFFRNVTMETGIRDDGYGLGVAISDLNGDNWPDIYVANDYIGNDCMWINNRNGSFTNTIAKSLNHQSYSSMGTDAADINNDGLPDIATLDMMPEDNERKKMMYSILNNQRHQLEKFFHYEPSFMQNTLQLNQGIAIVKDTSVPVFSEIAHFSGVAETDWSWSVLAADFDNDGYKDLHITNGMGRDMINSDFVKFRSSTVNQFDRTNLLQERLKSLGPVLLPNYFYRNNHNYSFENHSELSGINELSISNGAAYADLDNDGDLDLVVNNINSKAFVFSNNSFQSTKNNGNYISFKLQGSANNKNGFGTIIKCFLKDSIILLEQNPVRGYLSTNDNRLFTGLGSASAIDSIKVIWNNDSIQLLKNIKVNQVLTLDIKNANEKFQTLADAPSIFLNYTKASGINFLHQDPFFFDYDFQRLLPQKFSSQGPGIAVADVNKDGLEDVFIGNGFNFHGKLFLQNHNGSFNEKTFQSGEKNEEDTGCSFLDADGDGDNDLLITSGTSEFPTGSEYYRPRLYLNDGNGNFSKSINALPGHLTAVTCVVKVSDFDQDGDPDLFFGGRIASGNYPAPPPSYLLQNNKGIFTDVTASMCPALANAGMVTDADFADIDGDKLPDLILAGEWMPLRIFKNQKNQFSEITKQSGLESFSGMWRSVTTADLDKDGDMDFVAGNMGLNNKYHFDSTYPLNLWYGDLDGNRSLDPIMGYYILSENGKKELYTARGLDDIAEQVPVFKKNYLLHKDFSVAKMEDVFKNFSEPVKLTANESASCWFENTGNGSFKKHILPAEAQFAPVNSILVYDFNNDGRNDILIAGNEYGNEVTTGYYDASFGLLLLGTENKNFTPVKQNRSGFFLRGDTRCLRSVTVNSKPVIIAAINNAPAQVFRIAE